MTNKKTHNEAALVSKTQRVLGFLVAKGLLKAPNIRPMPTVKLDIVEILLVAEKAEPRVLEVLPAMVIHFPRSLYNLDKLPTKMKAVIAAIKRSEPNFENYDWVKYKDMKDWANLALPDKRTKPQATKRRMKSFRFSPEAINQLKLSADKAGMHETEYLERLIFRQ